MNNQLKKYYFEIANKKDGEYTFQSGFFNTTKSLEKWIGKYIDFIDFSKSMGYIMIAEYKNDCWEINKCYSYIDEKIFKNLKETYKNEQ